MTVTDDLRRSMREIVSLFALPAVWIGYRSTQLVDDLADVLLRALDLEFVLVSLHDEQSSIVAARAKHKGENEQQEICSAIHPLLAAFDRGVVSIENPFGTGTLRAVVVPVSDDPNDVVAAASDRHDFPTETERLILGLSR